MLLFKGHQRTDTGLTNKEWCGILSHDNDPNKAALTARRLFNIEDNKKTMLEMKTGIPTSCRFKTKEAIDQTRSHF
jgi:hypothetical protein